MYVLLYFNSKSCINDEIGHSIRTPAFLHIESGNENSRRTRMVIFPWGIRRTHVRYAADYSSRIVYNGKAGYVRFTEAGTSTRRGYALALCV